MCPAPYPRPPTVWWGLGHRCSDGESSTSIRTTDDGGQIVTDGTFAETKEVLGGYYVIEAADLDEALSIAKQVPAPFGGVEVRPIDG